MLKIFSTSTSQVSLNWSIAFSWTWLNYVLNLTLMTAEANRLKHFQMLNVTKVIKPRKRKKKNIHCLIWNLNNTEEWISFHGKENWGTFGQKQLHLNVDKFSQMKNVILSKLQIDHFAVSPKQTIFFFGSVKETKTTYKE